MSDEVAVAVARATAPTLDGPNWEINLLLTDSAGADARVALHMCRLLAGQLSVSNPRIVLLTLTLLDSLLKNANGNVMQGFLGTDFLPLLARLATSGNSTLAPLAAGIIQCVALAATDAAASPAVARYVSQWQALRATLPASMVPSPDGDAVATVRSAVAVMPPPLAPVTSHAQPERAARVQTMLAPSSPPPAAAAAAAAGSGAPPTAHAPVESEDDAVAAVAAMSAAFSKLEADFVEVRRRIASAARCFAVSASATPANEDFLQHIDFLQQCLPRLTALAEAGMEGVIENESVVEAALSLAESISRILQHGVPILSQAETGSAAALAAAPPVVVDALADLTTLDDGLTASSAATPIGGSSAAVAPASPARAAASGSAVTSSSATAAAAAAAAVPGAAPPSAVDELASLFGSSTTIAPTPAPAPAPPSTAATTAAGSASVTTPAATGAAVDPFAAFDAAPAAHAPSTSLVDDLFNAIPASAPSPAPAPAPTTAAATGSAPAPATNVNQAQVMADLDALLR